MPLVCSAFRNHLHLRATRVRKVRGLTKCTDFEFFDRFNRCSYNSRGHRAGLCARQAGKVLNITDGITGHVVGVITTINGESILIHVAAPDVASRRHTRIQAEQGRRVAAEVRQQFQLLQIDCISNRRVRRLEFRTQRR